jgi:formate hydrogenlyase transcriptional activator
LTNYPWPGNIRELQNVIERAVILATEPTLRLDCQLMPILASTIGGEVLEMSAQDDEQAILESSTRTLTLDEVDRNHIRAVLQLTGGVIDGPKGAAKMVNIHPNTLRHRMKKLGIRGSRHRPS